MACGCETYTCIEAFIDPCNSGVELPIQANETTSWNALIEFNGNYKSFGFEVSAGQDIILPVVVFNEYYTHELRITNGEGVTTCYNVSTYPTSGVPDFTPQPPISEIWQWGEVDVNGNTVSSTLFGGDLSPIIWVNEQPIDWESQGVIRTGDTLDFTVIGGAYGKIIFQYKELPA